MLCSTVLSTPLAYYYNIKLPYTAVTYYRMPEASREPCLCRAAPFKGPYKGARGATGRERPRVSRGFYFVCVMQLYSELCVAKLYDFGPEKGRGEPRSEKGEVLQRGVGTLQYLLTLS